MMTNEAGSLYTNNPEDNTRKSMEEKKSPREKYTVNVKYEGIVYGDKMIHYILLSNIMKSSFITAVFITDIPIRLLCFT